MAGQKITEKQLAAVIKSGATFLITQPEGEAGSETESLRRVQISAVISALRGFGLLNGYSNTAQMEAAMQEYVNAVEAVEGGIKVTYGEGSEVTIPIESSGGADLSELHWYWDAGTGYLHMYDENDVDVMDPVWIGGGGGSSGGGSALTFSIYTSPSFSVIESTGEAEIEYKFTSIDKETEVATGTGNLAVYVGGVMKTNITIPQGDHQTVDVFDYLSPGTNSVRLTVTDSYGNTATRNFTVTMESFSLSWSLADTNAVNDDNLSFYITPTGNGSKSVYTKLDGTIVATDTVTTSGRRLTKALSNLTHGAHMIEVYGTVVINGVTLESNHLKAAVAVVLAGQTTPVIAVKWPDGPLTQYTSVNIPYVVIDPTANPATIRLMEDDDVINEIDVDQSAHVWAYRPLTAGYKLAKIVRGITTASKQYAVQGLDVDAEEITDGLTCKIDPSTISDLRTWRNNGYSFTLSPNFDTVNGGVIVDEDGVHCIRITAGDTLTLNLDPFAKNAITNGLELKMVYKIENSSSKTASGIKCLQGGRGIDVQANNVYLYGNQNHATLPVCEGEKTELDINIQKKTDGGDRLMMIWEKCSSFAFKQYAEDENFRHGETQYITFGCADADVYLYLMRAYNRDLTNAEIKANYIVDGPDGAEIHARSTRNDIYDGSGNINFQLAAERNPDAHFILINAARMTEGKKDEVVGTVRHICISGGAAHSFTAPVKMKVQGTSSVEHAKTAGPNINFNFYEGITLDDGTHLEGYAMHGVENSIPTKLLTFKKNVASEDHIVNRACSEWYHRFQPSIRPMRVTEPRARDCLESVMCAVFFCNTAETAVQVGPDLVQPGETVFFGLGNLCSNKDAAEVFLYDPIVIEVKNNTEPQVRFKSDNLTGDNFDNNFEFRYLDESQYTEAQAKALWQETVTFIHSCDFTEPTNAALPASVTYAGKTYTTDSAAYRKAKWISEAPNRFDMDAILWHHNITLFHLLRDNRAKNMFWSYDPTTRKWSLRFAWDHDTGHCRNNEGYVDIEPGWMDWDVNGTADVFNGADNVVFVNLRECNFADLQRAYLERENAGAWNADTFCAYIKESQEQLCESLWIEDAEHNGIRTLQNLGTAAYLARATGKLALHLKKSVTFQKALVDSYYNATACTADSSSFRGYTPNEWAGVAPSGLVEITPYTNMYVNVLAGNTSYRVRAQGGEKVQINITAQLNDTEIYLRSAGWVQEIGDLSGLYLGQFEASRLTRVKTLLVGSSVPGYRNTAFTTATFTNCKKLETLNLGGLVNAAQTFDLSNNLYLKQIYTKSSGVTGLRFAKNGRLETAELNALASLYMSGLWALSTFNLESWDNLSTLTVENCPQIDTQEIVEETIDNSLSRLRLLDVNWRISSTDFMDKLLLIGGLNDSGTDQDKPFITGAVYVPIMKQGLLALYNEAWHSLSFTYDVLIQQHTARFANWDGTLLPGGEVLADRGAAIPDPVSWWKHADAAIFVGEEYPVLPAPENGNYWYDTANEQLKVFTSEGWENDDHPITVSATAPALPTHGDWWYNTESEQLREWNQGHISPPTRESSQSTVFTFDGWNDAYGDPADLSTIIGDCTIYAAYAESPRQYTLTWIPGGDQPDETKVFNYGDEGLPTIQRPVDTTEEQYQYYKLFKGWDKSTGFVCQDLTGENAIRAVYSRGGLPQVGTDIADMTYPEIFACIASDNADRYFEKKDMFDIVMGYEPEYGYPANNPPENTVGKIPYVDVIPYPVVVNGNTCMSAGNKMFENGNADGWTMVIDFEFTSNAANQTLLSCFQDEGMMGFKLFYNGGPQIRWGTNSYKSTNCTTQREMAVIRHVPGSKDVCVYFSNHYKQACLKSALTKTIDTQHGKAIYVGGHMGDDSAAVEQANGVLYSVRLWKADLGETECKKLCRWPHETYTYEVTGTKDYYLADAPTQKSGLGIICNSLLARNHQMNTTNTNEGGYAASDMNDWMDNRVSEGYPEEVQSMIQRVTVYSNHYVDGTQGNVQPSTASVFIPASAEMFNQSQEPWVNEGKWITYYTTDASRIKYNCVQPRADAITFTQDTDPTLQAPNNVRRGDQWCNTSDSNKYYIWDGFMWRLKNAQWYWLRGATVAYAATFSGVSTSGAFNPHGNNASGANGVCPRLNLGRRV